MVNKKILFKLEHETDENFSIPKYSPEEIGHILLTIEKGFSSYDTPLFEGKKYELKDFPVDFRNIIEESRIDITFLYKVRTPIHNEEFTDIIGFNIDNDIKKIDIVSFFTKAKNSKSEHRIYQIGGKYSEAIEDARDYWEDIKNKSKEEILDLLEKIIESKDFKNFPLEKKVFYLDKLRDKYREFNNDEMYWKIQREIEKFDGKRISERRKITTEETKIDPNPFGVSLEKFSFLKKSDSIIATTKSLLYRHDLEFSDKIPDITVDNIADLLIDIQLIPHYVDIEEKRHNVNFKGVIDETRKDLIYHYVQLIPLYDNEKIDENGYPLISGYKAEKIIKIDIVSFISEIIEGRKEHRIYQIGRRYAADDLTFDDLYGLGEANYELENYNKALEFFDLALNIDPNNNDVKVFKGLIYVCLKDFNKAISLYKQVLKELPDDSITWDNLGIAYEELGDEENAREAFKKAYELDPDDKEIKEHYNDYFQN